ncbi:MAG: HlyD family efflux transporter periplasmic adaptor subunit [Chitinophagales bacterium]|jgi:multidrug resistance efflux pump|nr:HlyD family efflux transporter periplasmic adaptor subunit [Chitinophagales bacterium]
MKRNFINLATIYILFTIVLSSCQDQSIKPQRKNLEALVFASGTLQWDNSYGLTAQTDGVLRNMQLEIGQKINAGQLLAQIDNTNNLINSQTAQEQMQIAQTNISTSAPQLLQLKAQIQLATEKYQHDLALSEKYQRLYQAGSVSKLEYDNYLLAAKNAQTALNTAQKQYELARQQAESQVINAKGNLQNQRILANYNNIITTNSGTVIERLKDEGDYVRKGELIARVANSQIVEAELNIDERSIGQVKIGQRVFVRLNTQPDKVYIAKISKIESAYNSKTQSFIAKATFEENLAQNYFGTQLEANILVGLKKNTLTIPKKYLSYNHQVQIKGAKAPKIVKVGIESTDEVEILEGLDENSIIIPFKR